MSTDIRRDPSCADDAEPALMPVDDALARILEAVSPIRERERVAVRDALGRVLGADVIASNDVPMHTNSAVDGYAYAAIALAAGETAELSVVGTAWAGRAFEGRVGPGQCVRIMTGAIMPEGTDTAVMQEHAERHGDIVRLVGDRPGANVRQAGEDLAAGRVALAAGRRITPADLGLIASVGVGEVTVTRRPRVAFFSNGDELRSVGQPLAPGEVYDSNRYTLYGMLTRLDADFVDLGVIPDDAGAVRSAFEDAARCADLVVTTAGASVGEADFVQSTLNEIGEVRFWKIAMKPGRPLAFGRVGDTPFFGLPGNPVAVMVTFYQFVRPALAALAGEIVGERHHFTATFRGRIRKRPGRTEYQRGRLSRADDGRLEVRTTGDQGSGILRSMSVSDCFIVLDAEQGSVEDGDTVSIEPFAGLI